MRKSCLECAFAKEHRNHFRLGEQVRCGFAEEAFGGTRWVDVQKSEKTGKVINSKCGQFKHALDALTEPKPVECEICKGSGKQTVRIMLETKTIECCKCNGKGVIQC